MVSHCLNVVSNIIIIMVQPVVVFQLQMACYCLCFMDMMQLAHTKGSSIFFPVFTGAQLCTFRQVTTRMASVVRICETVFLMLQSVTGLRYMHNLVDEDIYSTILSI